MTYLEHITNYFVALLGKGVTLSSRDLSVVQGWEAAGVPAGVACRAIRREVSRRRDRRRVSLADVRLTAPLADAAAEAASEPERVARWIPSILLARLTTAGRAAELEPLREAYRAVYRLVRDLPERQLSPAEVARLDQLAVSSLERALAPAQRRTARRRARQRARQLAEPSASSDAKRSLQSALLEETYAERYGLRLPSDLLLDEETQ